MIQRKPLRDEIQKEIVARISDGRLAPGGRINETHLAEDLGISRTPLREAMLTLSAAGFLASDMGRGWLVPILQVREFTDLQSVLAVLAPPALSAAGPPAPKRLMELGNVLNRARLPGGQALPLPEAVFRWAHLVIEDCSNVILRAEVLRLEGLSRRYWRAAAEAGFAPAPLVQSLGEIYELLRGGRLTEAGTAWSGHINRFGAEAASFLAVP